MQMVSAIRAKRRQQQLMSSLLQKLGADSWRDREVQQRASKQLEQKFRNRVSARACCWGHLVACSMLPGRVRRTLRVVLVRFGGVTLANVVHSE